MTTPESQAGPTASRSTIEKAQARLFIAAMLARFDRSDKGACYLGTKYTW